MILLTSFPAVLLVTPSSHINATTLTLYFSTVTGYLGVTLLLWMYTLGAKSIFGLWFSDIAPIMKIHRLLGTYGAIAILLHPLLVLYSYGESLLYPLIPHISTAFERHVTLGRIAFLLFAIIWLSSALLRKKMGHRPWKYIHYLAYICLPFALLHIPGTGSQYLSHEIIKAYFFVIVIAYLIISVVRLRGFINSDKHAYVISRHGQISNGTYLLEAKPVGSRSEPKPGQYVYIKLGVLSEDHPFSVVTTNEVDGTLTLAYRTTGRFTDYLKDQEPGTKLLVSDAHGSFLEPLHTDEPTVFIAGGIGITPFVAPILQSSNDEMWLFYANRTHETSTFNAQLAQALGARSISIYSQENAVGEHEEHGYITPGILRKYLRRPELYNYYICGPELFMEATKAALTTLGVDCEKIRTEAFEF